MSRGSPFTTPEEFLVSRPVIVAIADLGLGNAASVANMCRRLGFEVRLSPDPSAATGAELVVLPGVGSWDAGMERLRSSGWDRMITVAAGSGVHVLGICLGMQLLCESSAEGTSEGLGLLTGRFERIDPMGRSGPRKVPHMGWNRVRFSGVPHLPIDGRYYFVHSYAYDDPTNEVVTGTVDHDGELVAAVGQGNVLGLQFHPEKSHVPGFLLMRDIGEWVAGADRSGPAA